jgi:enterochelin esterase family protein
MKLKVLAPLASLAIAVGTLTGGMSAQEGSLTPAALQAALAAQPQGADADRLAERIRTAFGGAESLQKGANPIVDQRSVAWAVDVPSLAKLPPPPPPAAGGRGGRGNPLAPRVVDDSGPFGVAMTRVGTSTIWAGTRSYSSGTAFTWHYEADGRRFGGGALEVYEDAPETHPKPGVPKGTVKAMGTFNSKILANTQREWWMYIPAQYRPESPAAVMVFQDGSGHTNLIDPKIYVPTTFDNLIAAGDMPVTVAIFITPGTITDAQGQRNNRSVEYDTVSDTYVRFLIDEMLPEAEKTVKLRHDGASRAITGYSSGAVASFSAAWNRPNEFGKVLVWVGSFQNLAAGESGIAGAHNYPALIRRNPGKPIRVFIQGGTRDAENQAGSWWLGNVAMAEALEFAGYDYRFVQGTGFHSDKHGRSIFPEALRWLWRDHPRN